MNREMPSLDTVVESAIDGEVLAVLQKRFQQSCFFPTPTARLWEKVFLLEAQQVPDGNETTGSDSCAAGRLDCRVSPHRVGHQ